MKLPMPYHRHHRRLRILLAVAVLAIAGSVLLVTSVQRRQEQRASALVIEGQHMLSAVLQAHTAVQGFAVTADPRDALEFERSVRGFDVALTRANELPSAATQRKSLRRLDRVGSRYVTRAQFAIDAVRRSGPSAYTETDDRALDALVSRFETDDDRFLSLIQRERSDAQRRASLIAAGLVVLLSVLFGGIGQALLSRNERLRRRGLGAEAARREHQQEFAEILQVTESEDEAYHLLKRHLERALAASSVTVMNRNNSRDRLEPRTPPEDLQLADRLLDAEPRSCLAIRLSRTHARCADESLLLDCDICGHLGRTTCVPALVSGEVIGSVLVQHADALSDVDRNLVQEVVAQAAPAIGNLRTLALAESRALTDALTGLPNTRAVHDTLKRMVAQAGRTLTPLSAVMVDLDHFKRINDQFGHEKGDEALAAVGAVIGETMRESDFAGRYGGEEFLILLPDTGKAGAVELAEKLRTAVAMIEIPGIGTTLTTSCGVSTYPEDGDETASIIRLADRALYAAKSGGRNMVAVAASQPEAEAVAAS